MCLSTKLSVCLSIYLSSCKFANLRKFEDSARSVFWFDRMLSLAAVSLSYQLPAGSLACQLAAGAQARPSAIRCSSSAGAVQARLGTRTLPHAPR